MPPAIAFIRRNWIAARAIDRHYVGIGILALLHLAAIGILFWTEDDLVPRLAFILTWAFLNCVWLLLLRRPSPAAAMSLIMVVILILLSQFKQDVLIMTANFVDVLLIDSDTTSFLIKVFPSLRGTIAL